MTTRSYRWRRVLMLCAASVALHYAAVTWSVSQPAPAPRPAAIVAELHSAPAAPRAAETGAAKPVPQVQLPGPQKTARPRYRTSLPPAALMSFDVLRVAADGARRESQAELDWRHAAGRYRLTMHGEAADIASEGTLGADGLAPRTLTVQRGGKAGTATHFDARRGHITFSASEASVPMAPGTQDQASLLMQLAAIARADARQLKAAVDVPVGAEKDAGVMRLVLVGQEEIETAMGKLMTWHWSQPPVAGTYRAHLDVWLAPGHEWYPVQLRSTEANGTVTTRTIRKIDLLEVEN